MNAFKIEGYIKFEKKYIPIRKELVAKDEKDAVEKFYCLIGSNYGKKRREIRIEKIQILNPKESRNPVVMYYYKKGELNG